MLSDAVKTSRELLGLRAGPQHKWICARAERQRSRLTGIGGQGRDAEGFGLGLAIVRQTVRSLGGHIELDSAPGQGTRFRIVLEQARVREDAVA